MPSALFDPSPNVRPIPRTGRLSALPLSIAVHVLVVLAVVVIPLLATDVLPLVREGRGSWMPAAPLPTPPPAPVPASRRAPALAEAAASGPPLSAPDGIREENGLQRDDRQPPSETGFQRGVIEGGIYGGKGLELSDSAPPPTPASPTLYRPGPRLRFPTKVVDVQPVYPEAARQARIEGVVIIEAIIGATGEVTEARVLRSRPLLDDAALAAVRQWRFTPSLLDGVPVPIVITVTVNFKLQ